MKNKKMLLKLSLFAMFMGGFCMSFTGATSFKLNITGFDTLNTDYISNNIIPIHFADNGNDFGGFFYFSNGVRVDENTSGEPIFHGVEIEGGSGYECNRQVKGFYYNAERGERLRPLDQETRATVPENEIKTTGGLYTVCSKTGYVAALSGCSEENEQARDECIQSINTGYSLPPRGYYGQVTHEYSGEIMSLIVGVDYDTGSSKFITVTGSFSPTFVRIDNQFPAGFIYDYNGGVGLVGCKIDNVTADPSTMKKLLSNYYYLKNFEGNNNPLITLFGTSGENLKYNNPNERYPRTGTNVNCSNAVRDSLLGVVIEGVVGMGRSGTLSNGEYIKNPQNQKMQFFSSNDINSNTVVNYARKKAALLCRGKWESNRNINCNQSVICIDDSKIPDIVDLSNDCRNKTIIVKNRDVKITPFPENDEGKYYDIFIDSGNLIINETGDTKQFVFNKNGFISGTNTGGFERDVDDNDGGTGDDVAIGSFIRGNFIVDGKIKSSDGSGLQNKYFIHGKITTRDTFETLGETFKWKCNLGRATNGTLCPMSNPSTNWVNPYQKAFLVIIDQNYNSPLFKN